MLTEAERKATERYIASLIGGPSGWTWLIQCIGIDHAGLIAQHSMPLIYAGHVVSYCERRAWTEIPPLLLKLLELSELRPEIGPIVAKLRQAPPQGVAADGALTPPVPPANQPDAPAAWGNDGAALTLAALETSRVPGGVFINRDELRGHLRKLASGVRRVLLIDGPRGSGKSHSSRLISHFGERTGRFRVALVSSGEIVSATFQPEDLARTILQQFGHRLEIEPEHEDRTARWVFELQKEITTTLNQSPSPCWVVLDGFNNPDLPKQTLTLIQQLAVAAEQGDSKLRLVLSGYRVEDLPAAFDPYVLKETIPLIGAAELAAFFTNIALTCNVQLTPDALDEVVSEVLKADTNNFDRMRHIAQAAEKIVNELFRGTT